MQAAPQPLEFGMVDAGPRTSGIDQAIIRVVTSEQERPEPGPAPFEIGPADHDVNPNLSNSTAFTNPARCQADSIMD